MLGATNRRHRLTRACSAGVFGRFWLVSATEVMQVLCGWRVKARR
jgi:hypothetical protein